MASDTVKANGFSRFPNSVVYKVGLFNLAVGLVGVLACTLISAGTTYSFSFGFLLGLVNILWLIRTARRGMQMAPERAGRYVAVNYVLRFILTVVILIAVITRGALEPMPLVLGIFLPIALTIGLTIYKAKEGTF